MTIIAFSTRENEESKDSPFNISSQFNGGVADKNSLLLDLDPEAPPPVKSTDTETPSPNDPFQQFANFSSQQDNKNENLLDFGGPTNDAYKQQEEQSNNLLFDSKSPNTDENISFVPQSNEQEHQLLSQAYDEVDHAAQELATKLDLVTSPSPPPTSDSQPPPSFDTELQTVEQNQATVASPKLDSTVPTATPAKKPTASATKPTSATKIKPTTPTTATAKSAEHKPTVAAKTTESKPAAASTTAKPTATRKTIHSASTASAAAASKPKVTPTSPSQDASAAPKPTVNIITNQ